MMRRRDFITLLGGAAAAWPLAACGQNPAQKSHEFLLWHEASTEEAVIYLGADLTKLPSERDA
jgi:putative tryptophan/tyrosine transport system substrate-binding protein